MISLRNMNSYSSGVKRFLRSFSRMFSRKSLARSTVTNDVVAECVGRDAPVVLEIGCNDGGSTLQFLKMFEKPKVYCFEPDPRAIARFKQNIGNHANVQLFELALSDRVGEVPFYTSSGHKNERQLDKMPEGWDLSGSIRKPKNHLMVSPWVKFDRVIAVKTTTLDLWSKEHGIGTIDFIWMDVQGAELDVFKGGRETLARTRFLYTEYSDDELYEGQSSLSELLERLKHFEVLVQYPCDVLLRNRKFDFLPGQALKQELMNVRA